MIDSHDGVATVLRSDAREFSSVTESYERVVVEFTAQKKNDCMSVFAMKISQYQHALKAGNHSAVRGSKLMNSATYAEASTAAAVRAVDSVAAVPTDCGTEGEVCGQSSCSSSVKPWVGCRLRYVRRDSHRGSR